MSTVDLGQLKPWRNGWARGRVRTWLLACICGPLLLLAIVSGLALSATPQLAPDPGWRLTDLSRLDAVMTGPDVPGHQAQRVFQVTQRDVEIVLGQAARRYVDVRFELQLDTGQARLRASLRLPGPLAAAWLNLSADLNDTAGRPAVDRWRIGHLPLPAWLPNLALGRLWQQLFPPDGSRQPGVPRLSFAHGQARLVMAWRDDSTKDWLARWLPDEEQQRLRAYAEQLTVLTRSLPTRPTVSLADLIGPLFAWAQRRSTSGQAVAAAENRAALMALTLYANGHGLVNVAMPSRGRPIAKRVPLTLNGRPDSPLHFLISASMAAQAGVGVADTAGLYKEVSDAQGGSGFSFNDLAADRAGTRFGLLATNAPQRLQALLAAGVRERDLMPNVDDLPDGLTVAEFAERFGRVGTPAYQHMMVDIEARLDRCRIFQPAAKQS